MVAPDLVTVEDLRTHLKLGPALDGSPSAEDAEFAVLIAAATERICLEIADRRPTDAAWLATIEGWTRTSAGSPSTAAPMSIRVAILRLAANFYRYRGDDQDERQRGRGTLPPDVELLIWRYRDPTIA